MRQLVALFGEAEKGSMGTPLLMQSLIHLSERLGNPPQESRGIFFAIQFLLCNQEVIYIRVEEEGFSTKDYLKGIDRLLYENPISYLTAVCLPGVGDRYIIDAIVPVIKTYQALMITTERDLYDYLTA